MDESVALNLMVVEYQGRVYVDRDQLLIAALSIEKERPPDEWWETLLDILRVVDPHGGRTINIK